MRQKATKAFYRQTVTEGADGGSRGGTVSEDGKHSPGYRDQSRRGRFIEELIFQNDSALAALTVRVDNLERCVRDSLKAAMQRVDERFDGSVQAQERTEEEGLRELREDGAKSTEAEGVDGEMLVEIGTQLTELQRAVEGMKERAAARALGMLQLEDMGNESDQGADEEGSPEGSPVSDSDGSEVADSEVAEGSDSGECAEDQVSRWMREQLTEEGREAAVEYLHGRHWTELTEEEKMEMCTQIHSAKGGCPGTEGSSDEDEEETELL